MTGSVCATRRAAVAVAWGEERRKLRALWWARRMEVAAAVTWRGGQGVRCCSSCGDWQRPSMAGVTTDMGSPLRRRRRGPAARQTEAAGEDQAVLGLDRCVGVRAISLTRFPCGSMTGCVCILGPWAAVSCDLVCFALLPQATAGFQVFNTLNLLPGCCARTAAPMLPCPQHLVPVLSSTPLDDPLTRRRAAIAAWTLRLLLLGPDHAASEARGSTKSSAPCSPPVPLLEREMRSCGAAFERAAAGGAAAGRRSTGPRATVAAAPGPSHAAAGQQATGGADAVGVAKASSAGGYALLPDPDGAAGSNRGRRSKGKKRERSSRHASKASRRRHSSRHGRGSGSDLEGGRRHKGHKGRRRSR